MIRSISSWIVAVALGVCVSDVGLADEAAAIQQVQLCCDAAEGGCCSTGCNCGAGGADGCCCKTCIATVEKETIEKHCWKVECRDVCVPKVVLPWQEGGSGLTIFSFLKRRNQGCCDAPCDGGGSCCSGNGGGVCCCNHKPRCGRVICVRDLEKETYECEECVYKWELRRLPPVCGNGCCANGSGCACGCGGAVGEGDCPSCSATATAAAQPVRMAARLPEWLSPTAPRPAPPVSAAPVQTAAEPRQMQLQRLFSPTTGE